MSDLSEWEQLDDLVQVSYTVSESYIVYSQFVKVSMAWRLYVLSASDVYETEYQGENALAEVTKTAPFTFVRWFKDSFAKGYIYITNENHRECVLRVGEGQRNAVSMTMSPAEKPRNLTFDLLVKLVTHVQKDGCHIETHQKPTKKEGDHASQLADLQRENERLRAQWATQVQEASQSASNPRAVHPSAPLKAMRSRPKGMSLVNPRVKRVKAPQQVFIDLQGEGKNTSASTSE